VEFRDTTICRSVKSFMPGVADALQCKDYSVDDGARQKFTQKERDIETGLDYFGLDTTPAPRGRFTSADPLLSSGSIYDPQTWNLYSYTLNNPLKYVDPFGLYEWDASLGGSATMKS